ncbi:hypothetical protein GCK72_022626 [Caenorhabditis remanei]|uniref:SET domain-containing protein n=1 Tax=Caenorhabditis remanei TaxID=31234 RepID=A0A6A5FUF3_CAERE|nr:hypothetical protein GCK72_022626 [Caenorhabditis remanei]KAF1746173.1 hypothetical protein GCK72_022626 [Caenorhabditis remanei]
MPRKKINWRRVRAANARHATQTRVEAHKKQGGGCSGMIREVEPMPDQLGKLRDRGLSPTVMDQKKQQVRRQFLAMKLMDVNEYKRNHIRFLQNKKIKNEEREKYVQEQLLSYQTVTKTVVSDEAKNVCMNQEANKPASELKPSRKLNSHASTACENPTACKCNRIFNALYRKPPGISVERKHRKVDRNGFVDMDDHNHSDQRIIVECSDACGCCRTCPNRQAQQGKSKNLTVVHLKDERGCGLETAEPIRKGELIGEYVGEALVMEEVIGDDGETFYDTGRGTSYEASFRVMQGNIAINSRDIGNVVRFLSHACEPNSAFVECHSRKSEGETLIPRIVVIALQDIAAGELVTISYYDPEDMKDRKGIRCRCKPACQNFLPCRYVDD